MPLASILSNRSTRGFMLPRVGLFLILHVFLENATFAKWAMLGSNQRPPPCKCGCQGFNYSSQSVAHGRHFRLVMPSSPFWVRQLHVATVHDSKRYLVYWCTYWC